MTSRPSLTSRLLVPLDGSALAEQALPYALTLAGPSTDIYLVQVVSDSANAGTAVSEKHAVLEQVAAAWGLPSERTHVNVFAGDPATTLLRIADTHKNSMIVLASHGRGALGRWRFGSVADRLVRRATIPTLVIRPENSGVVPGGQAAQIERLVVPLDGSELAEQALPAVGELAGSMHLPVRLVRVVPAPLDQGLDESEVEGREEAQTYLDQAKLHSALRGATTATKVLVGEPALVLLELTAPEDLVVLSSHGRSGVTRWLVGSVAEKLVRLASAPVLMVPDVRRTAAAVGDDAGDQIRELLMKETYSPREVAMLLGRDVATVNQAALSGKLKAHIVNHNVISIRREDLVRWLRDR